MLILEGNMGSGRRPLGYMKDPGTKLYVSEHLQG